VIDATRIEALAQIRQIEERYRQAKRDRHKAWRFAAKLGIPQAQIARAAGVARTTVGDQLWIRSED
jgi:hypothetical protein